MIAPSLVSAVNQPSKYDHRRTGGIIALAAGYAGSRPSTNRASTITSSRSASSPDLDVVSAVNQPSKYDHARSSRGRAARTTSLGRQPTEQVRSLAPQEPQIGRTAGLGRQPTEQVRSLGIPTAFDRLRLVSAVNQPSKYDHGRYLGVESTCRRVSAVNQPSKYDHLAENRWVAGSSICGLSLGRQPTEQVRSPVELLCSGDQAAVSAVNQPSKYDHSSSRFTTTRVSSLGRQPTEQVRSPPRDRGFLFSVIIIAFASPRTHIEFKLICHV